jgi:hypothetical protein
MNKPIFAIALSLGVSLMGSSAMAAQDEFKVIDTIAGSSQKLIQTALSEFTRHGLDLNGYRIVVLTEDGHHVVLFEDLEAPAGQRGSTSKKPSFEVELSEDGARVVRANFVR